MGRRPCCSKEGLNRGLWTAAEDKILTDYIQDHGEGGWRNLPKNAGLKRCGKSCRLRWLNYLRPDIKRGNISHDEEELIIRLHKLLGNRWSLIAGRLPGRTDNEIKNYWNTKLGKKATSSTHSHSKKNSNEKNKKKIETPSMAIANTDTESKNEPHLVRTQAVMRCSLTSPQPQNTEPIDTNTVAAQAMVKDMTFTPHEECHPSDFMLDVNMGEPCLSDLPNSDFSGLLFPEEMLEDWTVCDNIVQPNEEYSNHHDHAFASFLGSGENWLAE